MPPRTPKYRTGEPSTRRRGSFFSRGPSRRPSDYDPIFSADYTAHSITRRPSEYSNISNTGRPTSPRRRYDPVITAGDYSYGFETSIPKDRGRSASRGAAIGAWYEDDDPSTMRRFVRSPSRGASVRRGSAADLPPKNKHGKGKAPAEPPRQIGRRASVDREARRLPAGRSRRGSSDSESSDSHVDVHPLGPGAAARQFYRDDFLNDDGKKKGNAPAEPARQKERRAPPRRFYRNGVLINDNKKDGNVPVPVSVFPGYTLVQQLKTGGMSDAINLVHKSGASKGRLFIEKRIRIPDGYTKRRAETELASIKRITQSRNRNLNTYETSMWGPRESYLSMILEYCDAGTLSEKIDQHRKELDETMSEPFLWHVLQGIANRLAFMHAGIEDAVRDQTPKRGWNAMCHLDLKPGNVFLSHTGTNARHPGTNGQVYPRVVIGDFGCVVTSNHFHRGEENPHHKGAGTPAWDAPEAQTRYGIDTDIWQLGAIVHSCARLRAVPDRGLLEGGQGPPCGAGYSSHLNSVVARATAIEPRDRYSATRLVREATKAFESTGMR